MSVPKPKKNKDGKKSKKDKKKRKKDKSRETVPTPPADAPTTDRKVTPRKVTPRKTVAKKTATKTATKKAPAKKAPAKKAPAKKAPAKKAPAKKPPTPLDKVLSPAAIRKLKKGYDPKLVNKLAQLAFETPYAPAGAMAKTIIDQFYKLPPPKGRLSARDREVVLLGRLVGEPGMNFMTHVYFGLMEGLTPTEILDIAYVSSLYGGADLWTGAAAAIGKVFGVCAKAAAADDPKAASTVEIIVALRG